jgi:hypothetical protein
MQAIERITPETVMNAIRTRSDLMVPVEGDGLNLDDLIDLEGIAAAVYVSAGPDDPYDRMRGTPLILVAARAGNASVVAFLRDCGVEINIELPSFEPGIKPSLRTAAILAAERGHVHVIRELADMSPVAKMRKDADGCNAATMAIRVALGVRGYQPCIGIDTLKPTLVALKDAGFPLVLSGDAIGRNPLCTAIFDGHPDVPRALEIWRELGGSFDLPLGDGPDGQTSLTGLINDGDGDSVNALKLIKAGFNVNQSNVRRFSPLHSAVSQGLPTLVGPLLAAAAVQAPLPWGLPFNDYPMTQPKFAELSRKPLIWAGLRRHLPFLPERLAAVAIADQLAVAAGAAAALPAAVAPAPVVAVQPRVAVAPLQAPAPVVAVQPRVAVAPAQAPAPVPVARAAVASAATQPPVQRSICLPATACLFATAAVGVVAAVAATMMPGSQQ